MDIDKIRIEQDEDILFLTIKKYKLFLKHQEEGGLDAMNLYLHYMFTARLQHTNVIKANDAYVRKGLGWGILKLKKSKSLLKKWKLIEYKQDRNAGGQMQEQYIFLRISSSLPQDNIYTGGTNIIPPVQKTAPPVDRPTGDEKQMLELEKKCFNKKDKENDESKNDSSPPFSESLYKFSMDLIYKKYGELNRGERLAITDKEGKQVKAIILYAIKANNKDPASMIQQKIDNLGKLAEIDSFYKVTPGCLLSQWNEITDFHVKQMQNKKKKQQQEKIDYRTTGGPSGPNG
jgi:hypothetical protein